MTDVQTITASTSQLEALQDLLSRSTDTHAWYEAMAERAEPQFRPVALKYRGLHSEQCDRIGAIMVALGGDPDRTEGIRTAVNRTSVSLRAVFDDIDLDMLSRIEEAEAEVISDFDASISGLPESRYREELIDMKAELLKLLGEDPAID